MAKPSDKDRVGAWDSRIARATKNEFEPWEQEYSTDMIEEYYYGKQQHGEQSQEWVQRKYVINLFYPSINISKPSMLFSIPKYHVTARPNRIDDPLSDVEARAKLQENALQTEVDRERLGYPIETGLAILDAQFRFGIVQIGYTADFVDNPNADKPVLLDDHTEMTDGEGKPVLDAKFKLKSESLYMQWIPAKTWRQSEHCGNRLDTADWCGYYKWLAIEDVQRNPNYKNTTGLQATGRVKGPGKDEAQKSADDQTHAGMIKVWFIWDMRKKMRLVFQQGGEKFFMEKKFAFLPFADLKFDERLGKYLPLPPSFNWVHPQNELNDIRETQRLHRKRAKRRYGRRPSVTPEEFAKLEDGEDMVCIELQNPETDVMPIPDAPLDQAVMQTLEVAHQDFTRVSGISGENQQVVQSETATQANLIAAMGQTREGAKRIVVAKWLSKIGRLILMTLRENMALPFWIKIAVDADSPMAAEHTADVKKLWKQIDAETLGDIDNDISVDLTSLSPIAREQERTNWLTFLQLLINPQIGMILSNSPTLLRKTAGLFEITNERDLGEVAKAMQAAALMFAQAMAQKAGVTAPIGGAPAPRPTPGNGAIAQQLNAQVPGSLLQ